jgi:uncharacterized protein (DUF433 family)
MDWEHEVAIDPTIQGGAPVIRGTRVPVNVRVMAVAAGDDVADVAEAYHVSEAQVRAATKQPAVTGEIVDISLACKKVNLLSRTRVRATG